jgi:hypothetical protein
VHFGYGVANVFGLASHLDYIFTVLWYEFHVWDPGGVYGNLGFVVLRRIYLLAWLINKEIDFILRLNALWFGVKDGSSFLFNFLLFFVPNKMLDTILYFYNESQLDNCTVSTTIECIGEQRNLCFWDEDSLHQLVVALFFLFPRSELALCN